MKKQALKFLFLSAALGGIVYSTASQSVADTNKTVKNNVTSTYSKDYTTAIDSRNNKKTVTSGKNKQELRISEVANVSIALDEIIAINEDLRRKYLNRSEFYEPQADLTRIDQAFITSVNEDRKLYVNLAMEDFGISTTYFQEYPDDVYYDMLENTQYGIDSGYLVGTTSPQPLDSAQKESIQLEVFIPKGTPCLGVENAGEIKYMIPRNQTLKYTDQELDKSDENTPQIYMTAELVDRDQLIQATEEQQTLIENQLSNDFHLPDNFVKLTPLGLNAGNILVNCQEVATTPFNILKNKNILSDEMFKRETLILTDGLSIHTEAFDTWAEREGMDFAGRRDAFENSYEKHLEEPLLGETTNYETLDSEDEIVPDMSMSVVTFSHPQPSTPFPDFSNNNNLAATTLHEFFHYLLFISESFKDRPMFNGDPDAFERMAKELATDEVEKLTDLLNDDYADDSWEEFICEAFMAKNHPEESIQTGFQEEVVKTNRFLDNLYDFEAPSVPNNFKSLDIEGDSVKLTFDHSTDDISVDKYIIYQDGQPVKTIVTEKDANGLSYANPGEHQPNAETMIDQLTQYTDYTFEVTAVDEAGNESEKSAVLSLKTKDTEAPKLKGSLFGTVLSSNTAGFTWAEPTDNAGVKRIKLHRTESDTNAPDQKEHSDEQTFYLSPTDTNYIDSTIVKGKTYTYYLTAVDEVGNESEKSNPVTIKTEDSDDEKKNQDRGEDIKFSEATIDWSGAFDGVKAAGFDIFGWFKGAAGWVFGSLTSVAGDLTSSVVDLSPGMPNLFVVVPVDGEGNPIADGLPISVDSVDKSSIQTKNTELYTGATWNKADNFISAMDEDGNSVPLDDDRITITGGNVDTSKPGVYNLTYSFKGIVKTSTSDCTVTVKKDQTTLELQDVVLYVGQKFDPNSVFKNVTDKDGNKIRAEDVYWYYIDEVRTQELDTSKPGSHKVRIVYLDGKKQWKYSDNCTVTVKDPVVLEDHFINEEESSFKAVPGFNPDWVTWFAPEYNGVKVTYDPQKERGIITKNPVSVLKNTNYCIYIDCTGGYIEITDADTGEVYLSKELPRGYDPDEKIPVSFPKDANVNVRLTTNSSGDNTFFGFTLEVDVDNM